MAVYLFHEESSDKASLNANKLSNLLLTAKYLV